MLITFGPGRIRVKLNSTEIELITFDTSIEPDQFVHVSVLSHQAAVFSTISNFHLDIPNISNGHLQMKGEQVKEIH